MAYWLIKSEPFKYSWNNLLQEGRTHWDGVRNYQARQNLQYMTIGDQAFFYHSNEGKEIVGIVEVVKEYYPDPSDVTGKFGMVDVKPITSLRHPVSLARIKSDSSLAELALIRQARLSVQPVDATSWDRILVLSQTDKPIHKT